MTKNHMFMLLKLLQCTSLNISLAESMTSPKDSHYYAATCLFLMLAPQSDATKLHANSWLIAKLSLFFCTSQIMLLLSCCVATATASVITSLRQLVLMPLSFFHPWPLCVATAMLPSCALWFIIIFFLWSPLCYCYCCRGA